MCVYQPVEVRYALQVLAKYCNLCRRKYPVFATYARPIHPSIHRVNSSVFHPISLVYAIHSHP